MSKRYGRQVARDVARGQQRQRVIANLDRCRNQMLHRDVLEAPASETAAMP